MNQEPTIAYAKSTPPWVKSGDSRYCVESPGVRAISSAPGCIKGPVFLSDYLVGHINSEPQSSMAPFFPHLTALQDKRQRGMQPSPVVCNYTRESSGPVTDNVFLLPLLKDMLA